MSKAVDVSWRGGGGAFVVIPSPAWCMFEYIVFDIIGLIADRKCGFTYRASHFDILAWFPWTLGRRYAG